MDSAGAIAGPLLALVLLARFGIRSVFWAAAVPGALAVLVAIFGIRETKRSTSETSGETSEQKKKAPPTSTAGLSGSFYVVLTAVTLFSLGNSSDMFLVMRAQSIGI